MVTGSLELSSSLHFLPKTAYDAGYYSAILHFSLLKTKQRSSCCIPGPRVGATLGPCFSFQRGHHAYGALHPVSSVCTSLLRVAIFPDASCPSSFRIQLRKCRLVELQIRQGHAQCLAFASRLLATTPLPPRWTSTPKILVPREKNTGRSRTPSAS